MNRTSYLSAIALTFFAFNSFAQTSFVEGYLITPANDTLKGFIQKSPTYYSKVKFKPTLSHSDLIEYRPSQLISFYIENQNKYFYSKTAEVDHKSIDVSQLDTNPTPKFTQDTLFVELLTKGPVSLYSILDSDRKRHFFFEKENNKLIELLMIKYYLQSNSMATLEIFKDQLESNLTGCPALNFKSVSFTEPSLQKLVENYNACKGASGVYKKVNPKAAIQPFVFAGISTNQLKFNGNDNYSTDGFITGTQYTKSVSPVFGIGLGTLPSQVGSPIGFDIDLHWKSNSYSGTTSQLGNKITSSFQIAEIRLGYTIRYTFRGMLNPFLRVGLSNGYNYQRANKMTVIRDDFNLLLYEGPVVQQRSIDFAYVGGAGVFYKNFCFEVRYEAITKTAASRLGKSKVNSFNFLLGYRFLKK